MGVDCGVELWVLVVLWGWIVGLCYWVECGVGCVMGLDCGVVLWCCVVGLCCGVGLWGWIMGLDCVVGCGVFINVEMDTTG